MTDTETLTLTDFLLARFAEDERVANDARPHEHLRTRDDARLGLVDEGGYMTCTVTSGRVYVDTGMKRRIVARCSAIDYAAPCAKLARGILGELAIVYADHPDYNPHWRP